MIGQEREREEEASMVNVQQLRLIALAQSWRVASWQHWQQPASDGALGGGMDAWLRV